MAAAACGQSDELFDRGIGLFREGYLQWNAEQMELGLQLMEQAPSEPGSLYWQAVARFHLVLCRDESGAKETIRSIEETVRRNPQDAEIAMMLAVLYGRQITEKPFRGLWLGRKIKKLRAAALVSGPDSPRVQSLAGACWFEAPSPFGDRELALAHLTKAAELYEAEQSEDPDVRQPRWGATDCYRRLGELMVERGELEQARFYYQSALKINPLYKPARKRLMELNDDPKK